jgi:hypothetical protein
MALGLKGGYTALYPGGNSFAAGLAAAKASLLAGTSEELVFVYADEEAPPEYAGLLSGRALPFAFGLLLARKSAPGSAPLSSIHKEKDGPEDFLKGLFLRGENP